MKIWHNGTLKNDGTAIFTATDRIRLGDGVFDTMLVVDGTPQDLDLHIERLLHDAGILAIPVQSDIKNTALTLIQENNATQGHYALNTIISRGEALRGLAIPAEAQPNIVLRLTPAPASFPDIHAIIATSVRRNEGSPLSQIKSFNYGDNILALKEAHDADANEAILLNNRGQITCATSGNIIIDKNGKLYTPPVTDGVLAGITRAKMIKNGELIEQSLYPEDIKTAQNAFVINSVRGMQKIVTLNKEELPHIG